MLPTYQDPSLDPFEVRVDAYSAAVGRTESTWYKPWTWRNSVYYVEKHSFNKFQDEEVPTQAKRREVKHSTGPKVDVEKDGKCWTEEPVEVFQYSAPYFVKMRWIEWWRVNKTLENFYGIAHDMEQAVKDIPDDAATALKAVTRVAGVPSGTPFGVTSAVAGGLSAAQTAKGLVLAGDGALTVGELGVVAAGIVAAGVETAATGVASVAVPAIVGSAGIVGSFVTFSYQMEKVIESAEKISEGWELVGHYYGKEVLERQALTSVMGPVHDCEHWASPTPPATQTRVGFVWPRWLWLGGVVAIVLLIGSSALTYVALQTRPKPRVVPAASTAPAIPKTPVGMSLNRYTMDLTFTNPVFGDCSSANRRIMPPTWGGSWIFGVGNAVAPSDTSVNLKPGANSPYGNWLNGTLHSSGIMTVMGDSNIENQVLTLKFAQLTTATLTTSMAVSGSTDVSVHTSTGDCHATYQAAGTVDPPK
jgi:hypothetical protein